MQKQRTGDVAHKQLGTCEASRFDSNWPFRFDSKMTVRSKIFRIYRTCPLKSSDTPIPSASLPQCIHVTTHPTNQQTSASTSQVSTNQVVIVIKDSVAKNTVMNSITLRYTIIICPVGLKYEMLYWWIFTDLESYKHNIELS